MRPRKHYREVVRALSLLNEPAAKAGVSAINDLLDERARLSKRVMRAEGFNPEEEVKTKLFPILTSVRDRRLGERLRSIPWSLIESHEAQAKTNHDQTLKRLAERGGLGASEAVAVLRDRAYHTMSMEEAEAELRELAQAHEA
jgi:hypothetical protein